MADPFGSLRGFHNLMGQGRYQMTAGYILRRSSIQQARRLIEREMPYSWFEQNWYDARLLAREFRFCAIFSVPEESNTFALWKIPGWRPKRDNGVV